MNIGEKIAGASLTYRGQRICCHSFLLLTERILPPAKEKNRIISLLHTILELRNRFSPAITSTCRFSKLEAQKTRKKKLKMV